jgi:protein-export membrane protein SecD/preprotein translocase SecF subunit
MEKFAGLKFTIIGLICALWIFFFLYSGINLGLDLRGGFELLYRLEIPQGTKAKGDIVEQTRVILQNRIDSLGMKEIRVQRSGANKVIVDLPGGSQEDKDKVKAIIERMGKLDFKLVKKPAGSEEGPHYKSQTKEQFEKARRIMEETKKKNEELIREGKEPIEPEEEIYSMVARDKDGKITERFEVILENKDALSGRYLSDVYPTVDQYGAPAVGFEFNPEGARKFAHLTRKENKHRELAIILDGVIQSAPRIEETIHERGIIHGNYTREEVDRMVIILRSGSLPTKPVLEREFSVGPALSNESISKGMTAIIISVIIIPFMMAAYYLGGGLIADFALLMNVILVLGTLAVSKATFTLPGLAGFVLSVGMSVDANILILERIREERAKGKSIRQAVETGYKRAFSAIFDSNVTTLITGFILLEAGTGPIKGFAVTLTIGIAFNMLTAILVTRAITGFLIDKNIVKELKMFNFVKSPNIPFLNVRHFVFTLSMIATGASLLLFFSRGPEKYGIDFTGGAITNVSLREPVSVSVVRDRINSIPELKGAEVIAHFENAPGEDPKNDISRGFVVRSMLYNISDTFRSDIEEKFKGESGKSTFIPESELKGFKPERDTSLYLTLQSALTTKEVQDRIRELKFAHYLRQEDMDITPIFEEKPGEDKTKGAALKLAVRADLLTVVRENVKSALSELLCPPGFEVTPDIQKEREELRAKKKALSYITLRKTGEVTTMVEDAKKELAAAGLADYQVSGEDLKDEQGKDVPGFVRLRIESPEIDFLKTPYDGVVASIEKVFKQSPTLKVSEEIAYSDSIGPAAAYNLKSKAIFAIILSLIAVIIYIAFRFEFKFGVAAIFALGHDVAIALGAVMLVDWLGIAEMKIDLPLVAAFLTIVGYSVNDTVVVFDRIREDLKRKEFDSARSGKSYIEILNMALNEVLSRTLLTGTCTLVVLVVLLLCGVQAILGFSFAMLVGIITGTYSSIFIATPLVIFLHRAKGKVPTKPLAQVEVR